MPQTRHLLITGKQFRYLFWSSMVALYVGIITYIVYETHDVVIFMFLLLGFYFILGFLYASDYDQNERKSLFKLRGVEYKWKSTRRDGEWKPRPEPTRVPWNVGSGGGWGFARGRF